MFLSMIYFEKQNYSPLNFARDCVSFQKVLNWCEVNPQQPKLSATVVVFLIKKIFSLVGVEVELSLARLERLKITRCCHRRYDKILNQINKKRAGCWHGGGE